MIVWDSSASIVISQRYIYGKQPSELEIEAWFRNLGFRSRGLHLWWNPELQIEIGDAHTGNLLKAESGDLIPIDVQVTEWAGELD